MEISMSKMKQSLRRYYGSVKKIIFSSKFKKELVNYKKSIWQTDEMADAFVRGSDGGSVAIAALMDKEVNEFFLTQCSAGNKVLDIGCGHGIVSVFLAQNGLDVTAIDISDKLLARLKDNIAGQNLRIEVKQGDAYNIPCSDEYFDIVVARMFLPHFPDWPKVLAEMARVTKRGGKLLVHFNSGENTELAKELKRKDCQFSTSGDISNPFAFSAETNDKELQKVAGQIGLTVRERTPVSFFINNRLFGYQLGTDAFNNYQTQLLDHIKDKRVEEFVLWFDREVISKCAPSFSNVNIITFEK
jgi:ubiquinone/menaquinone biosynthesis C-methylase UbiE